MLPLFNPLCLRIDAATSTFSSPLSDRTLEGHLFLSTAAKKSACTVARRLFVTAGILTSGLTPLFIRSMRTGPRHWRARVHREIT